ncbi:MAG TPA: hypothetical protein VN628_01620 [Vicinamibacterales bacterium]|nr:hypothetical protein [Vicinamibacterales bacterium]
MDEMSKHVPGINLRTAMPAIAALLVASGLVFIYAEGRMHGATFLFLAALTLALAVVVAVFLRRMNDPAESVEQMLYRTDHPARRLP